MNLGAPCKPGTSWLIDPCILYALGSLSTYQPHLMRKCRRRSSQL